MPKFTARHYKEIAFILSCMKPTHSGNNYDNGRISQWCAIVDKFCEEFIKDDPKFKKEKFMEACE